MERVPAPPSALFPTTTANEDQWKNWYQRRYGAHTPYPPSNDPPRRSARGNDADRKQTAALLEHDKAAEMLSTVGDGQQQPCVAVDVEVGAPRTKDLPCHMTLSRRAWPWVPLGEPATWRELACIRMQCPTYPFERMLMDASLLGVQYASVFHVIGEHFWASLAAAGDTAAREYAALLRQYPRLLETLANPGSSSHPRRRAAAERKAGAHHSGALMGAVNRVIRDAPLLLASAGGIGRRGAASAAPVDLAPPPDLNGAIPSEPCSVPHVPLDEAVRLSVRAEDDSCTDEESASESYRATSCDDGAARVFAASMRKTSVFNVASMPSFRGSRHLVTRRRPTTAEEVPSYVDGQLKRGLQLLAESTAHAEFVAAVDDLLLFAETRTDRAVELLALATHQLLEDARFEERHCDDFFALCSPPQPMLCTECTQECGTVGMQREANGPTEEVDVNHIHTQAPPRMPEFHPATVPLQILDSYWDLHGRPVIVRLLEPIMALLADPAFILYDLQVVRQDLDVHMTQPGASVTSPTRRPAAVAPLPPSPEKTITDNILRALYLVATQLVSATNREHFDSSAHHPRIDEPLERLPAAARYLSGLLGALVSQRIFFAAGVAEGAIGGGSVPACGAGHRRGVQGGSFVERFKLLPVHDTKGAREVPTQLPSNPEHALNSGAQSALFATANPDHPCPLGGGPGDPSLYPCYTFPLCDVAEHFGDTSNPMVLGLLHCRVQRHLLVERVIVRYLKDPQRYALFPSSISSLSPGHPVYRHARRNSMALAYYLYHASAALPLTEFFTVEINETVQGAMADSASLLPPHVRRIARPAVVPCRKRTMPDASRHVLDFSRSSMPPVVRVLQWQRQAKTDRRLMTPEARRFVDGQSSCESESRSSPAPWVRAIAAACDTAEGSAGHVTFLLEHFALMASSSHVMLYAPFSLHRTRSPPEHGRSRGADVWSTSVNVPVAECVAPSRVISAAASNLQARVDAHRDAFMIFFTKAARRVIPRKVAVGIDTLIGATKGPEVMSSASCCIFDHTDIVGTAAAASSPKAKQAQQLQLLHLGESMSLTQSSFAASTLISPTTAAAVAAARAERRRLMDEYYAERLTCMTSRVAQVLAECSGTADSAFRRTFECAMLTAGVRVVKGKQRKLRRGEMPKGRGALESAPDP